MATRNGAADGAGGAEAGADRRAFLRTTAAGVAAAAGTAVGLPGTAGAARSAPADLPNPPGPGDRYAATFRAPRTPVSGLDSGAAGGSAPGSAGFAGTARLDFQGEIGFQVTAGDPQHPWNVRMRVTRFRATAFDSRELGQVTLELGTSSPEGLLVVTSEHPPRWRHAVLLDLAMTVENPPAGSGDEPLVLRSTSPAELTGDLDLFPPQGSDYVLDRAVGFASAGGDVEAELSRFPMRVGNS